MTKALFRKDLQPNAGAEEDEKEAGAGTKEKTEPHTRGEEKMFMFEFCGL